MEIPTHSDPVKYELNKDLDEGKWVRVGGCGGTDETREEIMASVAMHKEAPVKPNFQQKPCLFSALAISGNGIASLFTLCEMAQV